MKKITKKQFIFIMKALENDNVINGYTVCSDNSITVFGNDGYDPNTYYFDDKDTLIDPKLGQVQKQIDDLEHQLEDLKELKKEITEGIDKVFDE